MSFCSPSLWQVLLLYSHPHTVQNNIANFCESMVFLCAPFHIPCVHESFLAHNTRNVTDWFIIVSSIVQFCVPGQVLLCRKRLVAPVARVTWIQNFALLTMSVQVKLGVSSEVTQVTNMFCEIGICWFLIMYSFLVGPQVAICRSIVNTLDLIRFDVTLEIFLFGMCWSYVVPQLLFAPELFITQIERGCNLCVDITIVVIEKGSLLLLLSPLSFSSPFWLIVIELL